jgi:hypothetical protein
MNTTGVLTHRESLGYWLNDRGLLGAGVEVGSAFGQFAGRILSTWKGKELYMVDPWEKQSESAYMEHTNNTAPFDQWYQQCLQLSRQDDRVMLMKRLSVDAAKMFKDAQLDFVYIDGNHDYGHVMEDLDAWWPKVKLGGLVGGHDCYDNDRDGACCAVWSALKRWTTEHNVVFSVTPCTSFWMIKA